MNIFSKEIFFVSDSDSGWTRPNLTENGTLGGNSFAVSSSSSYGSGAYAAVDGNTSTYLPLAPNDTFTFYNPKLLNVTELVAKYSSSSYYGKVTSIKGGNKTSSMTSLSFTRSGTREESIILNNSNYYRYYTITFAAGTSSIRTIRLSELYITAMEAII